MTSMGGCFLADPGYLACTNLQARLPWLQNYAAGAGGCATAAWSVRGQHGRNGATRTCAGLSHVLVMFGEHDA